MAEKWEKALAHAKSGSAGATGDPSTGSTGCVSDHAISATVDTTPAEEAHLTTASVITSVANGTMKRKAELRAELPVKRHRDTSNTFDITSIATNFVGDGGMARALEYAASIWDTKLTDKVSRERNAHDAGRAMAYKYRALLIFFDAEGVEGVRRLQAAISASSWEKQLKAGGLLNVTAKALRTSQKEEACARAAGALRASCVAGALRASCAARR
eukprot:6288569-Prymnesium_polylepis.1